MRVLILHSDIPPDAPPDEQDTLLQAAAVGRRRAHRASRPSRPSGRAMMGSPRSKRRRSSASAAALA